jgi:hypothetical protein
MDSERIYWSTGAVAATGRPPTRTNVAPRTECIIAHSGYHWKNIPAASECDSHIQGRGNFPRMLQTQQDDALQATSADFADSKTLFFRILLIFFINYYFLTASN